MVGVGDISRVLVTGARGRVGLTLTPALAGLGYSVTGMDLAAADQPTPGVRDEVADLFDAAALRTLCREADAIVHLAGCPDDADWTVLNHANVEGVMRLCDAAAGVRKIIFASSIHVAGYAAVSERLDAATPIRPDSLYGVSKVAGEAMLRLFHERTGIAVYILRIGTCRAEPLSMRERTTWLEPTDAARVADACLRDQRGGFQVIWGLSANRAADIDRAAWAQIDYAPAHDAEDHLDRLSDEAPGAPGEGLIGGRFVTARP